MPTTIAYMETAPDIQFSISHNLAPHCPQTCNVWLCVQDVVYFFQPQEDCLVTVATCNSAQFVDSFDTVLYVLANATGPGEMGVLGCNDDACSYFSQLQVSS